MDYSFFSYYSSSSKAADTMKTLPTLSMYSLTSMSKDSGLAVCNDYFSQTSLLQLDYYEFNCPLVPIYPKVLARLFRRPPTHLAPEFLRKGCISMAPGAIFCNLIFTAYFASYFSPLRKDLSCFNF